MVTATFDQVASVFEDFANNLDLAGFVGLDQAHELDIDSSLEETLSGLEVRLDSIESELCKDNDELDLRLELAWAWQQRSSGSSSSPSSSSTPLLVNKAKPNPSPALTSPSSDKIPAIHGGNSPAGMETIWVTLDEFNSVSSYMRGRLTLDRVNNAAKELLRHAESNRELVLALRRNQPLKSDKKHASWLSHNIVPAVKHTGSKLFVVDTDLKQGTHLQMGSNSSRSLLTILRHLVRI